MRLEPMSLLKAPSTDLKSLIKKTFFRVTKITIFTESYDLFLRLLNQPRI